MKLPKSVKIGAHTFKVIYRKMDNNFGEMDDTTLTITIDNTMPQTQQEETLIHEILHAIRKLSGTELERERDEERVVQSVAHLLYQTLKDNRMLG